jgi:hypothetical protein
MPEDLKELRGRIANVTALVDVTFLNKLCDELDYRLEVCLIIRDRYIKHL